MDGIRSMTTLKEVVYGSSSDESPGAPAAETSSAVRAVALTIYGELERIVKNYGDSVVTALVPQMVAVLEYWDKSVREKHSIQLELDLLRADSGQLLKQFERERQLRRTAEQSLLEAQDSFEEQHKAMSDKLTILEKNFKLLELKSKLQMDQSQRFEEKEAEMRKEYEKLHSRYTELFKSYMDYADRTKPVMGQDKADARVGSSMSGVTSREATSVTSSSAIIDSLHAPGSPGPSSIESHVTLPGSVSMQSSVMSAAADVEDDAKMALPASALPAGVVSGLGVSALSASLDAVPVDTFDELEPEAINEVDNDGHVSDDGSELTESQSEAQSEDLSSRYDYGVTREFEKLIRENQELVEMKNALNVVKDDLISQLEQKSAEMELLRVDLAAERNSVTRLTEELKKSREALQMPKAEVDEDGDSPSQRKRFTRVEMARVIYERNQYKERFVELQETVRWTEMARAQSATNGALPHHSHGHQKKSGFWGFFSGLVGADEDADSEKHERNLHTVHDV